MKTIPALERYAEYMKKFTERNKREWLSLNYAERQKDFEQWEKYRKNFEKAEQADIPLLMSDEKRKRNIDARNQFEKNEHEKEGFLPDVSLYESLFIFFDYLRTLNQQTLGKAA